MSSDALKKRKSKVLRSEGGTPEMKRGRGDGEQQVTLGPVRGTEGQCVKTPPAEGLGPIYCIKIKNKSKIV